MHPFVCLACGKGFKYEHSLNFHIKSYHGLGSGSNTGTSLSSTSSSNLHSNEVTSTVMKTRNRSLTSSPPLLPLSSSSLRVKCKTEECLETPHHLEDSLVIDKKAEHFSASAASPSATAFKEEKQRLERNRVRYENTSEAGSHVSDNTSDPCDLRIASVSAGNDTGTGGASSEGISSSSSSESLSQTDFGFPAKVASKGIEIKTEKALISVMEGVHTQSDQTYILYKCCLCGYAFPCLEPMLSHMQSNHFNQSSLTCEKCGASFRWKSELQLHEQLHRAMDHQQQQGHPMVFPTVTSDASSSSINSSKSSSIASLSNSNNNNNNVKHSGASLQSLSSSFPTPFSNLVLFPHPFLSSAGDKFAMESLVNADNLNILSNLMNKANGINIQDNNNGRSTRNRNNFIINNNQKNNDSHVNERMDCTFSDQVLNLSSSSRNLVKQSSSQEQDSSHMKRTHSHQELIDYRTRGGRRSSSPSSLERTSKLMKHQSSMNHHHPSVTISSQDALMISKANPAPVVSGEIEEIAPGQFKCRYCDKTFDRVFSVHRHERVHTGFKPCICKVCGRGFSEKRNLRHHIIRFHSDGSGRELLKRARKDKALAASAKHLAASVMIGDHAFPIDVRVPLNNHSPQNQSLGYSLPTSQSNHLLQSQKQGSSSSSSPGIAAGSPDTNEHKTQNQRDSGDKNRHHLDNKQDSNNRSWREESDDDENLMITSDDRNDDHHSLLSQSPRESQAVLHVSDKKSGHNDRDDDTREVSSMERDSPPSTFSSSRRRKGKPSKKIVVNNCHATEDEEEITPREEDDEKRDKEIHHHQEEERDGDWDDEHHARVQSDKKSGSQENGQFPNEDMTEDEEESGLKMITNDRPASRSKSDGNFSETDSNSNGGNHSENSLEISLNSGSGNSKSSKGHGAFFSSYSPRLGIVEKPIKRNEVCRPMLGPDGKYLYPCGYCSKTFCSLSDLNRHMNFHEDVRPFKCEYCDYQSRTNSQLKVHMMRHAGIKQYLCQVCNYNGVTQSDLNRHSKTRSHILRASNVCPLCSLGFSTSMLLKDHLDKFHDLNSPSDSMRPTSASPPSPVVCDLSVTKQNNSPAVNGLPSDHSSSVISVSS